ncbi:predicted protein [Histoplasma mississippiense (nom. inval.)]|uniref:predicted protein n=1 Tax=Ajellomyces capsulatus (strain NAm1 / WU24) TaxID=2059318 RepID=UPI000157C6D2|nr:predicted protein [Histoplasma mississippiense (nom. inval.)]EDN08841.1 predicted protein [Histoplasma mississippiense (nom. inval.)]
MAVATLTDSMRNTHLSDSLGEPECLLFNPQGDTSWLQERLDKIPRFLFRVASPRSDGETNETWVRSESASRDKVRCQEDTFSALNSERRRVIARALNEHLRWWPKYNSNDNFVSWTSSLLFALQYVFYRHLSASDGSSLEEIKLYVLDTTRFPRGTFIRDLDLIGAFRKFDDHPFWKNLDNLWRLRVDHGYYFGEYLSQGSLKIVDKCQMITAQALTDENKLYILQPLFKERCKPPQKNERPDWTKEVRRFRSIIWPNARSPQTPSEEMHDKMKAVHGIANMFDPGWKLPLAVYFAALIEPETEEQQRTNVDTVFSASFRSNIFSGSSSSSSSLQPIFNRFPNRPEEERKAYAPLDVKVIAPDTMPELIRVQDIFREIYKDSRLRTAFDLVAEAESSIRSLHIRNVCGDQEDTLVAADSRAGQKLLSQLDTIKYLCELVSREILPSIANED